MKIDDRIRNDVAWEIATVSYLYKTEATTQYTLQHAKKKKT